MYLAICLGEEPSKVIGVGEIFGIDTRLEMVNVGYSIREDYWHQGIVTEAVHMMVKYLFEVVEVNRIQAHVILENQPSSHVLLKNGLRQEGLIRQGDLWNGILQNLKDDVDFESSEDFFEDGLLDSYDIVNLVEELQEAFDIAISGRDIVPENFASLKAIEELLEKYN